jgi:hypothetical protein
MFGIPYYDTQDDISIAGRKYGSAFIPIVNGGDFPLRPLHPRKLNIRISIEYPMKRVEIVPAARLEIESSQIKSLPF